MSRETEHLHDKDYLGDGVYVGHDGFHVVLWLEWTSAFGENAIALDPDALARLQRYAVQLRGEEVKP